MKMAMENLLESSQELIEILQTKNICYIFGSGCGEFDVDDTIGQSPF
jgi:hypothetical protein